MSGRTYLAFGSNNGDDWKMLAPVEAGGSDQALGKARVLVGEYRFYSVVPARNWASATPEVNEREPVVKWKPLRPSFVAGKSAAPEAKNEAIAEAREALRKPVVPGEALLPDLSESEPIT